MHAIHNNSVVIQSVHMNQLLINGQLAELPTYPPLQMVFTVVANTTRNFKGWRMGNHKLMSKFSVKTYGLFFVSQLSGYLLIQSHLCLKFLRCDWVCKGWLPSTQKLNTLFVIIQWLYTVMTSLCRYFYLKLPRLLLLWLVSKACQTSTSTWVVFKWLHIFHTTGCNSPHD